jgi:PAS domain S-box-containing protein
MRNKKSSIRYKALFETSAEGIIFAGNDGCILECNEAFAEMLGYSTKELIGKTSREITPADWHDVDQDEEDHFKSSGHSDEYKKEFLKKNGSRVPVSVRAWIVHDSSGKPLGYWAVCRDLSERIQYESFMRETLTRLDQARDALMELDRTKTDLVATVSHELRAPLATIESSLNAMKTMQPVGQLEEREDLLRILDRGVLRLSKLVEELMDMTRIESGGLKLERQAVDAMELADRVVKTFEGPFADKDLTLALDGPTGGCASNCDPRRIEQVLTNLIDNALKFTEQGRVLVRVERDPANVVFSVQDSGPGIPTELHQKVFEKFFSLDDQPREGRQGVGLGLAISKGIVEAHGGRIWISSRRGAGSTFSFEIPNL